jgi:hypothetical protein
MNIIRSACSQCWENDKVEEKIDAIEDVHVADLAYFDEFVSRSTNCVSMDDCELVLCHKCFQEWAAKLIKKMEENNG